MGRPRRRAVRRGLDDPKILCCSALVTLVCVLGTVRRSPVAAAPRCTNALERAPTGVRRIFQEVRRLGKRALRLSTCRWSSLKVPSRVRRSCPRSGSIMDA